MLLLLLLLDVEEAHVMSVQDCSVSILICHYSRILKRHNLFTERWPFVLDLICRCHFRSNANLNIICIYIDNRSRLRMVVKRLLV